MKRISGNHTFRLVENQGPWVFLFKNLGKGLMMLWKISLGCSISGYLNCVFINKFFISREGPFAYTHSLNYPFCVSTYSGNMFMVDNWRRLCFQISICDWKSHNSHHPPKQSRSNSADDNEQHQQNKRKQNKTNENKTNKNENKTKNEITDWRWIAATRTRLINRPNTILFSSSVSIKHLHW